MQDEFGVGFYELVLDSSGTAIKVCPHEKSMKRKVNSGNRIRSEKITGIKMMAKLGQTKRAVMIELVSVLILAFVFAYSRMSNPPATTYSSVPPLVEVQVPVPSWTFSAAPGTKPAQIKAKIPPRVAKSTLAAKPVPVPIVAATIQNVPEPAPVSVPKETVIPVPGPAAVLVAKPAEVLAPVTVTEPALAPISKEASDTVPELASAPVPKVMPASVLSQTQALPSPSESITPTTTMVAGTTAAIVLAPIVAPVAIIVGIAVGMFTPSASQLGQAALTPKTKPSGVPNNGSNSNSNSNSGSGY
jgi:hypothetical protein